MERVASYHTCTSAVPDRSLTPVAFGNCTRPALRHTVRLASDETHSSGLNGLTLAVMIAAHAPSFTRA